MKIILGSASPRRKQLMDILDIKYDVLISHCDEYIDTNLSAEEIVISLSLQKARAVSSKCDNNSIIIGADTIVYFNGEILGKPKDKDDAIRMLNMLSCNTHSVYTGFSIINNADGSVITDYEKSDVSFRKLTQDEILKYVESENVLDKAGSYSIQGTASSFVSALDGDYNNVVGLPIFKLSKYLYKFI